MPIFPALGKLKLENLIVEANLEKHTYAICKLENWGPGSCGTVLV
jgi:hypothetical protein